MNLHVLLFFAAIFIFQPANSVPVFQRQDLTNGNVQSQAKSPSACIQRRTLNSVCSYQGFFSVESSCKNYVVCVPDSSNGNGHNGGLAAYEFECPEGKEFHKSLRTCVAARIAECSQKSSSSSAEAAAASAFASSSSQVASFIQQHSNTATGVADFIANGSSFLQTLSLEDLQALFALILAEIQNVLSQHSSAGGKKGDQMKFMADQGLVIGSVLQDTVNQVTDLIANLQSQSQSQQQQSASNSDNFFFVEDQGQSESEDFFVVSQDKDKESEVQDVFVDFNKFGSFGAQQSQQSENTFLVVEDQGQREDVSVDLTAFSVQKEHQQQHQNSQGSLTVSEEEDLLEDAKFIQMLAQQGILEDSVVVPAGSSGGDYYEQGSQGVVVAAGSGGSNYYESPSSGVKLVEVVESESDSGILDADLAHALEVLLGESEQQQGVVVLGGGGSEYYEQGGGKKVEVGEVIQSQGGSLIETDILDNSGLVDTLQATELDQALEILLGGSDGQFEDAVLVSGASASGADYYQDGGKKVEVIQVVQQPADSILNLEVLEGSGLLNGVLGGNKEEVVVVSGASEGYEQGGKGVQVVEFIESPADSLVNLDALENTGLLDGILGGSSQKEVVVVSSQSGGSDYYENGTKKVQVVELIESGPTGLLNLDALEEDTGLLDGTLGGILGGSSQQETVLVAAASDGYEEGGKVVQVVELVESPADSLVNLDALESTGLLGGILGGSSQQETVLVSGVSDGYQEGGKGVQVVELVDAPADSLVNLDALEVTGLLDGVLGGSSQKEVVVMSGANDGYQEGGKKVEVVELVDSPADGLLDSDVLQGTGLEQTLGSILGGNSQQQTVVLTGEAEDGSTKVEVVKLVESPADSLVNLDVFEESSILDGPLAGILGGSGQEQAVIVTGEGEEDGAIKKVEVVELIESPADGVLNADVLQATAVGDTVSGVLGSSGDGVGLVEIAPAAGGLLQEVDLGDTVSDVLGSSGDGIDLVEIVPAADGLLDQTGLLSGVLGGANDQGSQSEGVAVVENASGVLDEVDVVELVPVDGASELVPVDGLLNDGLLDLDVVNSAPAASDLLQEATKSGLLEQVDLLETDTLLDQGGLLDLGVLQQQNQPAAAVLGSVSQAAPAQSLPLDSLGTLGSLDSASGALEPVSGLSALDSAGSLGSLDSASGALKPVSSLGSLDSVPVSDLTESLVEVSALDSVGDLAPATGLLESTDGLAPVSGALEPATGLLGGSPAGGGLTGGLLGGKGGKRQQRPASAPLKTALGSANIGQEHQKKNKGLGGLL